MHVLQLWVGKGKPLSYSVMGWRVVAAYYTEEAARVAREMYERAGMVVRVV